MARQRVLQVASKALCLIIFEYFCEEKVAGSLRLDRRRHQGLEQRQEAIGYLLFLSVL